MSAQKFYADLSQPFAFDNGAIGYRSGGSFDCLGPYAKIKNCPIVGIKELRLTCYATGYADTYWTVPACTRHKGKYISGYFTYITDDIAFVPSPKHRAHFGIVETQS